ncbi:MAG: hypothetical protein A2901_04315 [Elusimicrobia bacterium RIFCSPLOWO2_01_FULL_54_10]|nr:MAG: hypothetical protein A2901_04315 [Elusimicrobia bacterium RIFCSPLOWO2_01_FULL_54_10]
MNDLMSDKKQTEVANMKVTKTLSYAMTCIRELATQLGDFVQVADIARKHGLPAAYCQKVLLRLSRAGMVESIKGQGFTLARSVHQLTPEAVCKAIAIKSMIALLLCMSFPGMGNAVIGLSTRFVDVTLENVPVGRPINLRRLRNMPYTVRNRGDATIEVKADVVLPRTAEIMDGYQSIPDPTWIQVIPDRFTIPPGQTAYAELVIQIPDKPEFIGKHYQVTIWAHSMNRGLYSAGTESRLRFSSGPGPETLKEEAKQSAMMTMDFDITPPEIYVNGVEPGKKLNLNDLVQKKMKVTNRAETPIRLKFTSVPWVSGVLMPSGYEAAPDPSWLTLNPNDETIKAERINTINPILEIPAGDEHRGKRYAFLIKTDIVMGVELDLFTKVLVTINPKKE